MTYAEDLVVLNRLGNEAFADLDLQVELLARGNQVLLELRVREPVSLQVVEETVNEIAEDGPILSDDFWLVEIFETSHQDKALIGVGLVTLEATGLSEHGFDCTQAPIVVDLLREQILR